MAGAVTIEAIKPVKVRFKTEGLAYDLRPGEQAALPPHLVQRLLEKAADKVRVLKPDWLATWRELAALSVGITQDSPRYRPMLDALTACDEAFKRGDWPAFWQAAEQAEPIVGRSMTGAG